MSETLFVVDVFSLVFQVFHAIPPMTGVSGQPTNAVFGFSRDLLNILRTKRPDYLVCALDSPGRGVREDIYPEYKAQREEMPPDLRPQIAVIKEVIEAFGIPGISVDGWEADDVLATLARRAEAAGIATGIITSDKDARQLLSPLIRLYNVRKDTWLDETGLMEDWGIRPDQVVDFQSLVGDAVDNVPGVPLIGPKKASALLHQFGTLEDVLARADEAPGQKLRDNLKQYAHLARISRHLVELNTHLDFHFDFETARPGRFDVPRLIQIFKECGFRRLIDEVQQLADPAAPITVKTLFEADDPAAEIITTEAALDALIDSVHPGCEGVLQLETSSLRSVGAEPLALTIARDDRSAAFIPLDRRIAPQCLPIETVWKRIAPLLAQQKLRIAGHDVKATLTVLAHAGLRAEPGLDSLIGSYLLEAGSRSHSLSALAERYLGCPLRPLSAGNESGSSAAPFKLEDLARHSAEEACVMRRVHQRMRQELEEQNLWPLYEELERPLIPVLAAMELTGIKVDADELHRQNAEVTARIETLMEDIHREAGEEFNIDSPKQLREILFDKLGLPVLKKTKTGASTDQEVLEELALVHPLPAKIIEHRSLVKLKGTYLEALPALINPATGRIHASFNQAVAATGRLSSSHPNLQNIPIRTPEGERIRRAFIAGEPGWQLVCADYSQIELRMLAHFSGDEALCEAFATGVDIHRAVAAEVFGVAPDQVDAGMRRIAKAVNFGVIYGQSAFGLSAALGITREEATAFIDSYFVRYAGVARFMEATLEECLKTGFARTILGRRRAISGIRPQRKGQLNMPERTAVNTVIQGSAADLIKRAMINIHQQLTSENHPGRLLLQIHDELVLEAPAESIDSLKHLVQTGMESAMQLSVPLTVDLATGPNWLDAK